MIMTIVVAILVVVIVIVIIIIIIIIKILLLYHPLVGHQTGTSSPSSTRPVYSLETVVQW